MTIFPYPTFLFVLNLTAIIRFVHNCPHEFWGKVTDITLGRLTFNQVVLGSTLLKIF